MAKELKSQVASLASLMMQAAAKAVSDEALRNLDKK
jgi:hypothetical protein